MMSNNNNKKLRYFVPLLSRVRACVYVCLYVLTNYCPNVTITIRWPFYPHTNTKYKRIQEFNIKESNQDDDDCGADG